MFKYQKLIASLIFIVLTLYTSSVAIALEPNIRTLQVESDATNNIISTTTNTITQNHTSDIQLNYQSLGNQDPRVIAANIINLILGGVGIIAISLILFGIINLAKSNGDQKKKKHAKSVLIMGIVCFILIIAAYALAAFILDAVFRKPVIYLYPEQEQKITVELDYQGELIADYPEYDEEIGGWEVTAYPDGRIINHADNQEYSYLFWEGKSTSKINWDLSTGFVVKGEDTRDFLRETLSEIGLTPKEYNEFIVYWYPLMMDNKYNLIHFAGEQYTDTAPLNITPEPDSMLRVFMVYKALSKEIDIEPQVITPFERKGFAVVEWGGTEVK